MYATLRHKADLRQTRTSLDTVKHTLNFILFHEKKQETLAQLMESKGITAAWIGARDVCECNTMEFTATGREVNAELWVWSPVHNEGDCVCFMQSGSVMGLVVAGCASPMSFVCQYFP